MEFTGPIVSKDSVWGNPQAEVFNRLLQDRIVVLGSLIGIALWLESQGKLPHPVREQFTDEKKARANFDAIWRTLRRMGVPDKDATDAAQEVFLKAFTQLKNFEGRGSLEGWLTRITVTTCINILRATKPATVKATPVKAGESVAVDQVIVEFE